MKYTVTKFTVYVAQTKNDVPITAAEVNDLFEYAPFRRVITEEKFESVSKDEVRSIAGLPFDSHLHDNLHLHDTTKE